MRCRRGAFEVTALRCKVTRGFFHVGFVLGFPFYSVAAVWCPVAAVEMNIHVHSEKE